MASSLTAVAAAAATLSKGTQNLINAVRTKDIHRTLTILQNASTNNKEESHPRAPIIIDGDATQCGDDGDDSIVDVNVRLGSIRLPLLQFALLIRAPMAIIEALVETGADPTAACRYGTAFHALLWYKDGDDCAEDEDGSDKNSDEDDGGWDDGDVHDEDEGAHDTAEEEEDEKEKEQQEDGQSTPPPEMPDEPPANNEGTANTVGDENTVGDDGLLFPLEVKKRKRPMPAAISTRPIVSSSNSPPPIRCRTSPACPPLTLRKINATEYHCDACFFASSYSFCDDKQRGQCREEAYVVACDACQLSYCLACAARSMGGVICGCGQVMMDVLNEVHFSDYFASSSAAESPPAIESMRTAAPSRCYVCGVAEAFDSLYGGFVCRKPEEKWSSAVDDANATDCCCHRFVCAPCAFGDGRRPCSVPTPIGQDPPNQPDGGYRFAAAAPSAFPYGMHYTWNYSDLSRVRDVVDEKKISNPYRIHSNAGTNTIACEQVKLIRLFSDKGRNPSVSTFAAADTYRDVHFNTPLHLAIALDAPVAVLKALVDVAGVSPWAVGLMGMTSLLMIVRLEREGAEVQRRTKAAKALEWFLTDVIDASYPNVADSEIDDADDPAAAYLSITDNAVAAQHLLKQMEQDPNIQRITKATLCAFINNFVHAVDPTMRSSAVGLCIRVFHVSSLMEHFIAHGLMVNEPMSWLETESPMVVAVRKGMTTELDSVGTDVYRCMDDMKCAVQLCVDHGGDPDAQARIASQADNTLDDERVLNLIDINYRDGRGYRGNGWYTNTGHTFRCRLREYLLEQGAQPARPYAYDTPEPCLPVRDEEHPEDDDEGGYGDEEADGDDGSDGEGENEEHINEEGDADAEGWTVE